jgi:hypothetical protein
MSIPFIEDLLTFGDLGIPYDDEDWGDVILPKPGS